TGAREEEREYWHRELASLPEVLELPTDRARPARQRHRGATLRFGVEDALVRSLRELGRRENGTLLMVLLGAFQVLLWRHSGQEDIAVGTPIAGRNRAELEGLIGCFVNTLVLRSRVEGNPTFRELLGRVRESALGAYEHAEMPFERLVEELQPER